MSVSTDNFLKAIYKIETEEMESANSTKLAEHLNISNAAVTDMAQNLARKGLVKYRRYKAIELTDEGEIQALKIIRKHRLWELFLMRVLDYPWHEVHQDAEMLEHQTSDRLLERIDQYLGQPAFDPHGEPIPDKQGNVTESEGLVKLTACQEGKRYKIVKITPRTDQITHFFRENGIQPGKNLYQRKKYTDMIEIQLEKTLMVIPGSIAGNIYVT